MAKNDDVILQSLEDHDYEIRLHSAREDGTLNYGIVEETIYLTGKAKSPKNITIIDKALYEKALKGGKGFAKLIESGKVVKLDSVPESFYDAKEKMGIANEKIREADKKVSDAKKALSDKDKEIEELKKKLAEFGAK